ncbi:hypothetical protein pipiens_006130 [Culex pipiens pipiens]|uniref:Flap endonuclease GEN n=1 Tax=Culex pipiens pipiens TaxID=38569 RepID=A0ABD1DRI6_CULPP
MGIKDLWNLLTPYCEKKPLFELNRKVVAIDLSGWVCESLNVVDYFVHPRFYLRNLFFRTCYLLTTGIVPVFVLEGAAPPLKYGVIIQRNQIQFRGARPKKAADCDKEATGGGKRKQDEPGKRAPEQKRNRFHHVLKQCEELLSSMGLVCVQAPGEAEALCAHLNRENLVHGIISQDSDCFAYGGVRVYRNFCASQNGGSVDIYDLENIRRVMDLGQEKIVVMGILSGCDYSPAGVPGVGRELVHRLIRSYPSREILDRIRAWRKTADRLTELEIKAEDKNVCADCGHGGKTFVHRRSGCADCRTKAGCDESKWKNQRANIKAELDIKRKALQDPEFPSEAIIDEFMVRPYELPTLDLTWRQPNFVKFIRSMAALLQWNEIYCFQKLLPLFTRWQIVTLSHCPSKRLSIALEPSYIKKKRSPKGVASYEIVWKDNASIFAGLVPDEQIQEFMAEAGNSLETLWSTIEPQQLVESAYSELVEAFLASKAKPAKKKAKKTQPEGGARKKTTKDPKQKRLEEFLNVISSDVTEAAEEDPQESGKKLEILYDLSTSIAGLNLSVAPGSPKHDETINMSAILDRLAMETTCDSDGFNLSAIVDRVCDPNYGRSPPKANLAERASPIALNYDFELNDDDDDDPTIERRLLLKQDVLGVTTEPENQSLLNASLRPRKRKSFFFEPIDVPPPELQDLCHNDMDMFECSTMLKDRIVVPPSEDANQTVIYDIDF